MPGLNLKINNRDLGAFIFWLQGSSMKRSALAALFVVISSLAFAHKGATGIVKERMDGMMVLGQSMKSLSALVKSGERDEARFVEIARDLKAHSGKAMNDRFPQDSLQKVSEAAPAIWENWERFAGISDELFIAANELEVGASNPEFDFGASLKRIGSTCSSCHEVFRIKK